MLERGFWLYVWHVETPKGDCYYVGRTGDSSSPYATPPYQRMGQHLGHQKNSNALRQYLEAFGVVPEECEAFHLIAHGPLYPQAADMDAHRIPRDLVAALEKGLADALRTAGYNILNQVNCKKPLDEGMFAAVRIAFGEHLPKLLSKSIE